MRARPREINIFNMSLLDILCGALGAFCFMMLVALPYYVVGKIDRAQSQQRTEELMKDVEKLRERMSDPEQAEELRKLIDELQAQIKQLEGQLNQYAYENDQLKQENTRLADENSRLTSSNASLTSENSRLTQDNADLMANNALLEDGNQRLTKENEELKFRLPMRRPFAVVASAADPRQDVTVFLEDEKVGDQTDKAKLANAIFNPTIFVQPSGWDNDVTGISVAQHGVNLWISSTTVPTSRYRVFVKGRAPGPAQNFPLSRDSRAPSGRTPVTIFVYGNVGATVPKTSVFLDEARYWALVGTLDIDEKGQIAFKDATEAERDDAWRTIMKADLPTPPPTATPAPSINFEERERLRRQSEEERRRMDELRRQRQGASPGESTAASATPESGADMAERALRRRREREAQSPAPSPQP